MSRWLLISFAISAFALGFVARDILERWRRYNEIEDFKELMRRMGL